LQLIKYSLVNIMLWIPNLT